MKLASMPCVVIGARRSPAETCLNLVTLCIMHNWLRRFQVFKILLLFYWIEPTIVVDEASFVARHLALRPAVVLAAGVLSGARRPRKVPRRTRSTLWRLSYPVDAGTETRYGKRS